MSVPTEGEMKTDSVRAEGDADSLPLLFFLRKLGRGGARYRAVERSEAALGTTWVVPRGIGRQQIPSLDGRDFLIG